MIQTIARVLTTMGLALAATAAGAAPAEPPSAPRMADAVKAELLHAWRHYEKDAWGHDALKPLSHQPRDWYAQSLLITPVDSLDTLLLMGLKDEADKDRELIATRLSFDKDLYVKNFEVTIRLLGGLLSGYQMTGDARLLALADDLGRRLLPVFDSPTGLPYVEVNLKTGQVRGAETNPAETGTLLLEFGTLSKLTGKPVYYDKAKRALVETFKRRSKIGLVGAGINVETGQWTDPDASVASGTDSYYEYLLKCWKLFGDEDCLAMWKASIVAINRYLADDLDDALWYGHADMNTGQRTTSEYGALDAFFPAVLALSGDIDRATRLQASSMKMWRVTGIEPEVIDYRTMKIREDGYQLRPEIVESNYYLWRLTDNPLYRRNAQALFDDFVRWCRTEGGYAALSDVTKKTQRDSMDSFLFAETFKYFWLTFAPPTALDFGNVVFNTEAHPLRATWNAPKAAAPVVETATNVSAYVNPLIGSRIGGNTFPGAVLPFGMVQWSPEATRGDHARTAAPGGYEYDVHRIRGFSLTHLSGTGCRGASGDIPFMPIVGDVASSPSADDTDSVYASGYSHEHETARAGAYRVVLDNGVQVELSATTRTGAARFSWPAGQPATLLLRTSDSEVGSSDARVHIDEATRTITGSVTSGNFCGYLSDDLKHSYYTLHFVAQFDRPFAARGTCRTASCARTRARPAAAPATAPRASRRRDTARAPTWASTRPAAAWSTCAWASPTSASRTRAPTCAPRTHGAASTRSRARRRGVDGALGRIRVDGATSDQLATFYTALYHSLLHPNVYSDTDGRYLGFDQRIHRVEPGQRAQYANFSGWTSTARSCSS